MVPDHTPEVTDCVGQGTLSCDVLILTVVTLRGEGGGEAGEERGRRGGGGGEGEDRGEGGGREGGEDYKHSHKRPQDYSHL